MNLSERAYSVLLVSNAENLNSAVIEMLPPSRYDYVMKTASISSAQRELVQRSYDFVIINSPLPDDVGLRFAIDASDNSGTVVLIIVRADSRDEIYAKLYPYGIFVISKPLSRQTLEISLSWLGSARERIRKLEKKTVSVEEKMAEIRIVNRAKWLLISELKMDEPSAHRYIEKQAMDRCVTRKEIAGNIIKTYS